jgi:hypothetical protein
MAGETKERVLEWLTSPDSCFLIGAGCSLCAGKPLIGTLTDRVIENMDPSIKVEFEKLKGTGSRPATVEDLINYLVRYQSILQTVNDTTGHLLQPDWIKSSLQEIKKGIVTQIADTWVESEIHARFLQRIGGVLPKTGRDIFTINYDTVIEATLDHLRIHCVDGFRGSRRGWFDPTIFDELPACDSCFKVYKLHGSINWIRESSGHVRRTVVNSAVDITDPVVVYPSEQKYLQTQFGVYETLMGRFREKLRAPGVNNRLVTLGYSFNDEHINEAIIDAVKSTDSNLTVIAFVGPDAKIDEQRQRMEDFAARCDQRFNAYVGNAFHVGGALDDADAKALLAEDLWQFEKLVKYIAGGAA